MRGFSKLAAAAALLLSVVSLAPAAEWQWSVPVERASLDKTQEHPRAFLWVPPDCRYVRGVVFAMHNMEEEGILESPVFRKTLGELGFAEVFVVPTFDFNFRFDLDAGTRFDAMLNALGEQSGYAELNIAPVVPMGHSAAASIPSYIAAWKPERTLAGISVSGQWPLVPWKEAPQMAGKNNDGVPYLVTLGEYEWAADRSKDGLKTRVDHPAIPLSMLACPADGHFDSTDEKIDFLCLYLKKAVQYRLPKDAPAGVAPTLAPIDPTKTGWLTDRWIPGQPPRAPAAPVDQYTGDKAEAFWTFDEETAKAVEAFQARHQGKPTLIGYVQNGSVLPQNSKLHQQVDIPFRPGDDGVTFKLTGAFLDTVPEGRPERWTGKKKGEPVDKPSADPSSISISRITGPIRQVSADTFELALNRTSIENDRRGMEAWLVATWPGDATFKRAIQQSRLAVPKANTAGAKQTITFSPLPDVSAETKEVKLTATADSGLPVRFFVREGPAEIDGDILRLTQLPLRAKRPVKVTVVAWQWGRASDPKVQTASMVEQTFSVK